MHELLLIEVPETLDSKTLMHPVTIMTRSPVDRKSADYLRILEIEINFSQLMLIPY